MLRLSKPSVGKEELEAVKEVLDSGWLAMGGGKVEEFEEKLAKYLGVDHAVAVSSCTAALHLALLSLDEKPRVVMVPDFTFPASGNAVILAGGRPLLVDVSLYDYNIDVDEVTRFLRGIGATRRSSQGNVIMPVHLFGNPCDMDVLCELSKTYDVPIIEDAACALGAEYRGKKIGTIGEVGCFSFHATKIITTGEGGALVTNNNRIAERARMLRNHGKSLGGRFFEHGYNYRMTDLQAAIGLVQLRKLDALIRARTGMAYYYDVKLKDIDVQVPPDSGSIYQRYVIFTKKSNRELIPKMAAHGIETAIGTWCLSEEPSFEEWHGLNPNAKMLYDRTLAIPLYPDLKKKEQDHVIECLKEIVSYK